MWQLTPAQQAQNDAIIKSFTQNSTYKSDPAGYLDTPFGTANFTNGKNPSGGISYSNEGGYAVNPAVGQKMNLAATTPPTSTIAKAPVSNGNLDPHINPATGQWDDNYYASQQKSSQPDLSGQIDSLYNPIMDLLNQQESSLKSGELDFYDSFTKPYDAQQPLLDQAKAQGLSTVEQQRTDQQVQHENALAAARRLYQELVQGSQQRFGGSSSAGEFANSLIGREYQRNQGQINQTTGQNMQKLLQRANEINDNYNTQNQSLLAQKEAELAKAKDLFRQRLDAITNSKITANENKAQLKLAELQSLRDRVNAINDQHTQFAQNLQLQNQAAVNNLISQIAAYQVQNGQPVDMNAIKNSVYSTFGGGNQQIGGGDIAAYYSPAAQTTTKKSPYGFQV